MRINLTSLIRTRSGNVFILDKRSFFSPDPELFVFRSLAIRIHISEVAKATPDRVNRANRQLLLNNGISKLLVADRTSILPIAGAVR